MNDNSEKTYFALLILCGIYVVFDVVEFYSKKIRDYDKLEQLESNQSNCIEDMNENFSLVDNSIAQAKNKLKEYKYQINIGISEHETKINISYNNIKIRYEKNLISYHINSKRLYNIALQTDVGQQISDVIEEYINL